MARRVITVMTRGGVHPELVMTRGGVHPKPVMTRGMTGDGALWRPVRSHVAHVGDSSIDSIQEN